MKLHLMTWAQVAQEMSIAGRPDVIANLGREIENIILPAIDATNRAELTNAELMLNRLLAEIRLMQRRYDQSHKG